MWRTNNVIKFSYDKLYIGSIPKPRKLSAWNRNVNLKKYIRFHYSVVQGDICAYCRVPLRMNGYGEPIEHIVLKEFRTRWMFHPKNLVLSCYGCNAKKHMANALVNPGAHGNGYGHYPTVTADFLIFHPHYDKFSDHITVNGLIFSATAHDPHGKGRYTIDTCKLNRLDSIYSRARSKGFNNFKLHQVALGVLRNPHASAAEIRDAQAVVNKLIERLQYWKQLHT